MIVGIDLGTSTSEIAYINSAKKPELIPNHLGDFITPSVVHIKEDGMPIVGMPAKEMLLLDPENTFIEVKRLMGTDTKLRSRGKEYTPVQLSSFILKYLVDCASEFLGEKIEQAVITVPAYFTDAQRKETVRAGEMIGLLVERIINEPTAASMDYGIMNLDKDQTMLVYDFGGGTLDVTVMEMFDGVIEVKSSRGNSTLGGKDLDEQLIQYISEQINKDNAGDILSDIRNKVRIKKAAEECKIALSKEQEYSIELPFLQNKKGQAINYSETITKNQFEELIKEKVRSTSTQVMSALADAYVEVDEIDLTLLVGGTTRIPYIANFLTEELDLAPQSLIDPDLGVVRGAAIQAGIINGDFENSDNELIVTDVCPYSLSTEVLDSMRGRTFCDTLIQRNVTIPVSVQKMYETCYDNQESVVISAYQGESSYPDDNILLNKFLLSGIPKARVGKQKIKITFSYDLNGILSVAGEILSTGKRMEIEIDTYSDEDRDSEIDLSTWYESPDAKAYRTIIRKAEKLISTCDDEVIKKGLTAYVKSIKIMLINEASKKELDTMKNRLMKIINDYEKN